MTPKRWQRSRRPGARQPASCRYCGRGTIYGNPFEIGYHEYGGHRRWWSREDVVNLYAQELDVIIADLHMTKEQYFAPLMGCEWLSCFCGLDEVCHVDVLIGRIERIQMYQQMEMEL